MALFDLIINLSRCIQGSQRLDNREFSLDYNTTHERVCGADAGEGCGDVCVCVWAAASRLLCSKQLVNRARWLLCACALVCRREPRVVARCRSAGHVAMM